MIQLCANPVFELRYTVHLTTLMTSLVHVELFLSLKIWKRYGNEIVQAGLESSMTETV